MEFSIKMILNEWVKRLWIIILSVVIGFVGLYWYTDLFTVPVYQTRMKVSTLSNFGDQEQMATAGNYINMLTLSQRRVATYLELMKTTAFYEQVSQASGTGYTPGAVGSMLAFEEVENMGFFYITITGTDPQAMKLIADAVGQEMYPFISKLLPDTAISVIEPARLPTAPINDNAKGNAVKGAVAGAAIAMAIIAAITFLDTHIKDEETLASRYNIPVLGVIPDFSTVTNAKQGGRGNG